MDEHQLDQFYDILSRTAERKGFSVHPLVYFQNLKMFWQICQVYVGLFGLSSLSSLS
ncbi:MAG: hypothetical protein ACLUSV_08935 [Streptococcus sp.]